MTFDLRPLKAECRKLLNSEHPIRRIIESEPDMLEGPEAPQRICMMLRIIAAHRSNLHAMG